jgi:hypothetical protein
MATIYFANAKNSNQYRKKEKKTHTKTTRVIGLDQTTGRARGTLGSSTERRNYKQRRTEQQETTTEPLSTIAEDSAR